MQEELETVAKHCKHEDCVYRGKLHAWNTPICQYALVEHQCRGCKISECDKYKRGEKIQPRMKVDYTIMWEYEMYDDVDPIWERYLQTDIQ